MRYLMNKSTNPYFNLALYEYTMKHIDVDDEFFFLWRNDPAVIIGKNQNAVEEINQKYIDENGVKVARRVSGGGAVYHDLGNLNFTFVINVDDPGKVNYKKYVQPIIDALDSMGIKAEASGRNDILIDGLKISGNAQRVTNGKLMHHGTLLFDVNLEHMVQALNVAPDKFVSKGVKSVRSRVTNIKEHLPEDTDIFDFWDKLQYYLSNNGQDSEIILTDDDIAKIEFEAMNTFSTYDWVYGASPEFDMTNEKRFTGGKVEVKVKVDQGHIEDIRFYGDYLGVMDVKDIEDRSINTRFTITDVSAILDLSDVSLYFGNITKEEILTLIFD